MTAGIPEPPLSHKHIGMKIAADRSIVHMDLDTFFVSVECLHNSQLKGKPLIIGGKSDRGVVASCSYEARKFGIHSAMPIRLAKRLCPDVTIISGDMEQYSRYSGMVTDIIRERSPVFEKSSIDEFYIDISGMDRFFGSYEWSSELRQLIIRETGLPISFGLSINKTVAKIATGEAKPSGQMAVPRNGEKAFLAPLSISRIPMVGKKNYMLLRNMGVATIATLSQMPMDLLERVFGKYGLLLWKRANAIDHTPVVPYMDQKSLSSERTFDKDTIDLVKLKAVFVALTERLAFQLRKMRKLTACITVKIRYSNFDTHTQQAVIPYTASDKTLIEKAKELFDKLYQRRMLIRLVGVRLSNLVQGNYQIDLFNDTPQRIQLHQAMDKIRNRYGARAIIRSTGIPGSGDRHEKALLERARREGIGFRG